MKLKWRGMISRSNPAALGIVLSLCFSLGAWNPFRPLQDWPGVWLPVLLAQAVAVLAFGMKCRRAWLAFGVIVLWTWPALGMIVLWAWSGMLAPVRFLGWMWEWAYWPFGMERVLGPAPTLFVYWGQFVALTAVLVKIVRPEMSPNGATIRALLAVALSAAGFASWQLLWAVLAYDSLRAWDWYHVIAHLLPTIVFPAVLWRGIDMARYPERTCTVLGTVGLAVAIGALAHSDFDPDLSDWCFVTLVAMLGPVWLLIVRWARGCEPGPRGFEVVPVAKTGESVGGAGNQKQ